MVVNGTRESDWDRVRLLALRHPDLVLPSYGLHPWWLRERSPRWRETLEALLAADPAAGVGETGLDRWMRNPDPPDQEAVFLAHLDLAARHDRPLSIHCLRAWGRLLDLLRTHPVPARGFLLHSYGGPPDLVPAFVALGARFSFSGHFLQPGKEAKRDTFRLVPPDRLLFETDAPDQLLPESLDAHPLRDTGGRRLNHPANLPVVRAHGPFVEPGQVAATFAALFGPPRTP
jgi:TatD DNase family protein